MEGLTSIQIVLLLLCGVGGLVLIIFILRTRDNGDDYDYDKIISQLNEQQEKDLEKLNAGNKEIDKVESEILKCKKELGMKLFKK